MNKFRFNDKQPKFFLGEDKVKKIYLGSELVYSPDEDQGFIYATANPKEQYKNDSILFFNPTKNSTQKMEKRVDVYITNATTTPDVLKGADGDICIVAKKKVHNPSWNMLKVDNFRVYYPDAEGAINLFDPKNPIYTNEEDPLKNDLMFVITDYLKTEYKNRKNYNGEEAIVTTQY